MDYPEFSARTRANRLAQLRSNSATYDAVIVGGGIVGAGLSRELALRGKTALVLEKGDFASGTSSKSSKLIHGGLRYLEMLDFHLVFEALSERHWLLKTHPHLVQPLEFVLPIYEKKKAPPGSRPTGLLGVGLWLYDTLSLFRTPFFHGKRKEGEMRAFFPKIRTSGLKGGYYYADAMMLDDELVLETLLDAERRGSQALNYVQVEHVGKKEVDGLYRVDAKTTLGKEEKFQVRAREVIVCVGPWTEVFGAQAVNGGAHHKLKPSKGVHLVFPWAKLPLEKCLVMYASDGRILFAIPRRDLGTGAEVTIVGTTDSPEKVNFDNVHAVHDDVEYIMCVLREYFPERELTSKDVVSTYAGVRPLIDDGAESEAKTSREHEIWRNGNGIVFMAGGKYTTFRKISEEIASFTFPKTKGDKKQSREQLSTPEDYTQRLKGTPIWGKFTDEWVKWKLEHHAPCRLADVILRRVPLWMSGREMPPEAFDRIAELCQAHFGWNSAELEAEKAFALKEIALHHSVL